MNFIALKYYFLEIKIWCQSLQVVFVGVQMKTHGPEIYALFNKKFSSFAIFDRKDNSNFLPYQCSLKYHAREQDKKFILGLMKWLDDHQIDTGILMSIANFRVMLITEFRAKYIMIIYLADEGCIK